ncbi:MAG: hypothetical protein JO110_17620 [Acetobacteraceae bacterium]|nr:hypothetical protein [Acetobacteraceae bacterium]
MTGFTWFALFGVPASVVALAWVAVRLHERWVRVWDTAHGWFPEQPGEVAESGDSREIYRPRARSSEGIVIRHGSKNAQR